MATGALGDSGKHMAHAQEHVERGEDSWYGRELVIARLLNVVEEGVWVQAYRSNTSHVSITKSVKVCDNVKLQFNNVWYMIFTHLEVN